MRFQRANSPLKLDGLSAAMNFFSGCFAELHPGWECLWVAHVDDGAQCLHISLHEGNASEIALPVREIILDAAAHGSSGLILAHNHPSGDPTPSDSDCRATRRLAAAAEALDCAVLDHLVFGGGECASFRRLGLL